MIGRVLAPCLMVFLLLPVAACAQQTDAQSPAIVAVEVGFEGHYRAGVWTPVKVTLRGGGQAVRGHVTLTVPDTDGAPSRTTTPSDRPIELAAGQPKLVMLYTRFGRVESQMVVEFRTGDGVVTSRIFRASATPQEGEYPLAARSTCRVVAGLSGAPVGIDQVADLQWQHPGEQPVAVRLESTAALPDEWYGYESLDALVVGTSKPELFDNLEPNGPQILALDKWIRMGGKLVLSVGSQGERILADGSPWARFRPGQLQRMVVPPLANSLEAYAGSSVRIEQGVRGRHGLRVPQLQNVHGTVEVRDSNLPLVIRRAWGLGQVIFVAADLDGPPLADWPDRGLLLSRLLDWSTAAPGELKERTAVMHYGFTDIAGQLRSALDQYSGVSAVSFSLVAGLVILYLVLIGPVDYFLLRKFSPRMELTWVTFPLVVIAFSVVAYILAYRFKGEDVRINQVSLIDVDTESKWLRGTSWADIFSPRMDRYDLTCRPIPLGKDDAPVRDLLFSWMGLPGEALGGMDPTTANPISLKQPYAFTPELNAMQGVPIQIWASKCFTSRWSTTTAVYPEARFVDEDQVITGRVINTLDCRLTDCLLVYGRWVYELGTLGPGEMASIGVSSRRRDMRAMMTGQRIVTRKESTKVLEREDSNKLYHESTPYEPSSVDLGYILRMMMFFDQSGGTGYTGLLDRYQNFVDMTSLLKADRAILVATVPEDGSGEARHGSVILRDGKPIAGPNDRRLTIYRFVYPVAKAE